MPNICGPSHFWMLLSVLLVTVAPIFCTDYMPLSSGKAKAAIDSCTTNISGRPALIYFDVPGRAELSRLIMKSGGYKFTDTRIAYEDWPAMKNDTNSTASRLFGQLPILEHGDNFKLAQSRAIAAYVADLAIPSTRSFAESRGIDAMFMDAHADIQMELYKCYYGSESTKFQAKAVIGRTIRPFLSALERILPEEGWAKRNNRPSIADLVVFDLYSSYCPGLVDMNVDLTSYPKFVELAKRVREWPEVADYVRERGF